MAGEPCPLCAEQPTDECRLCGGHSVVSAHLAAAAAEIIRRIVPVGRDLQAFTSSLKIRLGTTDLGRDVFDVGDIVNVTVQVRVTDVTFSGDPLARTHSCAVIETVAVDPVASPRDLDLGTDDD